MNSRETSDDSDGEQYVHVYGNPNYAANKRRRRNRKSQWMRKKRKLTGTEQQFLLVSPTRVPSDDLNNLNLVSNDVQDLNAEAVCSDISERSMPSVASTDDRSEQHALNEQSTCTCATIDSVSPSDPDIDFEQTDKCSYDAEDQLTVDMLVEREIRDNVQEDKTFVNGKPDDFDELFAEVIQSLKPDVKNSLWSDLREAMLSSRMNTVQMDAVLKALDKHSDVVLAPLPKSHKTLTRQSRVKLSDELRVVSGHLYYSFPLEDEVKRVIDLYKPEVIDKLDVIELVCNTDGFPLHNSTRYQGWPVMCFIANVQPRKVFDVALTAGKGKPSTIDYLLDFIHGLKLLVDNGLQWKKRRLVVKVKAIVCDAPARADVKCIKHHTGAHGCDQCSKIGKHDGKRMIWVGSEGEPRTDHSFREQQQSDHHKGNSPLLALGIDMIRDIPPDFMHQGGGTMKKILSWLTTGPRRHANGRTSVRMSATNIRLMDERIIYIQNQIPEVFCRKCRTSDSFLDLKFTELRQLLLYTGKVIFKDILASEEQYDVFLSYSIACALMVDPSTAKNAFELHSKLMRNAVERFPDVFGSEFMTYNAHSNLHFPEVARYHGSLESISAYPFENHIGQLKRDITSSHNPLISMIKGRERRLACETRHSLGPREITISTKIPNNVYIDRINDKCYEAISIVGESVRMKEYMRVSSGFEHPLPSKCIGFYQVAVKNWRYVHFSRASVHSLRQGIKIDLTDFPGTWSEEPSIDQALFISLLHNQSEALH